VRVLAAAWLLFAFGWAVGCDFRIRGDRDRPLAPRDLASPIADADLSGVSDGAAAAGDALDAGAQDAALPADLAGTVTLPVRIHVNGAAYTGGADFPGSWAADPGIGGVCSGAPYSTKAAIRATTDDVLFQTEMAGTAGAPLTCAVRGLPAGKYTVTLLFAEIYFGPGCPGGGTGTGARVFDIVLEGAKVFDKLDLFALGHCAASTSDNKGKPIVKSFDVEVDDGTLDLAFPASVDRAKISAIQIVAAAH
jgi:hypothetical protein